MTLEHNTLLTAQVGLSDTESAVSKEMLQNQPIAIEPGQLELQHCQLMQLQGQETTDQLVAEACELVSRVRQLGLRLEEPRLRQYWQGILTYWSIYAYRAAQLDLDADLLPFDSSTVMSLKDDQFPYRFEEDSASDSQEMLGWRRLLDECERDLSSDQLLTVVGDAGSGRRFLLCDLLLPMLRSGRTRRPELAGSENWRYIHIFLGGDPIRDLVKSIADSDARDEQWVTEQVSALRADPMKLAHMLELGSNAQTLLIFERFGSLLASPSDERAVLVEALAALLKDPQKRYFVAVTLRRRQTFLLAQFGALENPLKNGHVLLAFTTAELRHLIEEPARRIGLVFEPGLIDQIMIDIQGEPTSLPLLQFTLSRLWANRDRNRITWDAYRRYGAGHNALRIALDDLYAPLSCENQMLFRTLLLAMVNLQPNGGFVTCEVSQDDLYRICGDVSTVDDLIGMLRRQSLLHERKIGNTRLLTLNNGAALRVWSPLAGWLDELQVRNRFRLRLKESATIWQNRGNHNDLLWRGAMLVEADREFNTDFTLTTPEKEFIKAGRHREFLELRKRNYVIGSIITMVLTPLVVFPFALWHHERQERRSQHAVECLFSGDLPGALLWLDDRERRIDLPLIGTSPLDAKLRQFAEVQLPTMDFKELQNSDDSSLDGMAISDDGAYVATINSQKLDGSETIFTVEVTSLLDWDFSVLSSERKESNAPAGCLTLLEHPTKPYRYLIAGMGQSLRCWLFDEQHPKQWRQLALDVPRTYQGSSVVDLNAGAGFLAVTWLTKKDRRLLSLFEFIVSEQSDDQFVRLAAVDNLEGLQEHDVRLVSLSTLGDLVAVFGTEANKATILKAWRSIGDRKWTLAAPPSWVVELSENENQRQRLRDCGWILTKARADEELSWQRDGSFATAISFSPSGSQFATASDDGQVLLWSFSESSDEGNTNLITPKFETELQLGSSVYDVAFLNDDIVATGGRDRTARIWNLHSGVETLPRTYHEGTVFRVAFIAGSNALITGTKQIRRIWQSPEYAKLMSPCLEPHFTVSASSDHITVARSDDGTSLGSDSKIAIKGSDTKVASSIYSPRGKWVCTTFNTEGLPSYSIDVRQASAINETLSTDNAVTLNGLKGVPLAVFSPDDRWLVVAEIAGFGNVPPDVYVWDLGTDSDKPRRAKVTWPANSSLNEKRSFYGMTFEQMAIADYKNEAMLAVVGQVPEELHSQQKKGVIFIGTLAWTGNGPTCNLKELRISQPGKVASSEKSTFPHEEESLCVGFSNAGDLLATGDANNYVKLWDAKNLFRLNRQQEGYEIIAEPIARLKHSSDVKFLAFSPPSGDLLATVSSEGEASIWSIVGMKSAKGRPAMDDKVNDYKVPDYKLRHDAQILCLSFSPSGEMIITGGRDRTARVWSIKRPKIGGRKSWVSWELVGIFQHDHPVIGATMPKDHQVRTVSRHNSKSDGAIDGRSQVRFWDVATLNAMPSSKLEEIAARRVSHAELEKLDASDFGRNGLSQISHD